MGRWHYFKDDEVKGLRDMLVHRLDLARELAGFPFRISSGLRDKEKNATVGGVPESSHIKGLAVDILAPVESGLREKMAWALGMAGFRRVGSYDRHFHVDIDDAKVQNVMWFGKSK